MHPNLHPPSLHDRVIDALVARERTHAVYPNLGGHRNACVTVGRQELYPDVVLCDRESFRIEHVVEVETEESVIPEKIRTWATEARGPWRFWLLVPRRTAPVVAALCHQHGIRARIALWSMDPDGIAIEWPVAAYALGGPLGPPRRA